MNWLQRFKKRQKVNLEQQKEANSLPLFSVKDTDLNTFGPVLEMSNAQEFEKTFILLSRKQPDNPLIKFAHKSELYHIGFVNKDNGTIKGLDQPELQYNLKDLLR